MKQLIIIIGVMIATLMCTSSCAPTPNPERIVPKILPDSTKVIRDTIQTIDITSPTIALNIAGGQLYFEDELREISLQKTVAKDITIVLKIRGDSVSYLKLGTEVLVTEDAERIFPVQSVPFARIDDSHIIVKKGATLELISRYYNVPVSELIRWNNLKSTTIQVNQQLKIKCDCAKS